MLLRSPAVKSYRSHVGLLASMLSNALASSPVNPARPENSSTPVLCSSMATSLAPVSVTPTLTSGLGPKKSCELHGAWA